MLIGNFYYEIPTTFPELNATSIYYVAFVFLVFCLARSFRSILRPLVLCLANIVFLYSFGMEALRIASIMALVAYISGIVGAKFRNKILSGIFVIGQILVLATYKYSFVEGLVMPLGLSFYTFRNISYTVDCYKDETRVQYNPFRFYAYSCFFASIVAGPISRSEAFFEDLRNHEPFDYRDVKNGGIQMLLGIFEKMVFSDFLAEVSNGILNNPEITGWNVVLGLFLYSFVIYLDFDSYSNIAIGASRVLGIHLGKNFNSPYLGYNLNEFWKRWHISLTSWLRDYVYIPLGGNRKGKIRTAINIVLVFFVSGIWHGNTLNFILWGLVHGLLRVLEDELDRFMSRFAFSEYVKKIMPPLGIVINFVIVSFLWLIFKYSTMQEVTEVLQRMMTFTPPDLSVLSLTANEIIWLKIVLVAVLVLDILRDKMDMLEFLASQFILYRWLIYIILIVIFLIFGVYGGSYDPSDFIYKWF